MLNKGQKVRILKFDTEKNYFNLYQIVEVHAPDKYGAWLVGDDKDGEFRDWYYHYNEFELVDSVVESIIEKFRQRSAVGIKKYNTTLDRTDLNEDQWKDHLLEELMDAILYLTKIRNKI
jgi:hypothetical protein